MGLRDNIQFFASTLPNTICLSLSTVISFNPYCFQSFKVLTICFRALMRETWKHITRTAGLMWKNLANQF